MSKRDDAALAIFRQAHGLDPRAAQRPVWLAQLGGLIIPLPNFRWRRAIIDLHDAHHLQTGYPPTIAGELLVAAWELGAACYRDWRARTLCALLLALGMAVQPRPTWRAFQAGRRESSIS